MSKAKKAQRRKNEIQKNYAKKDSVKITSQKQIKKTNQSNKNLTVVEENKSLDKLPLKMIKLDLIKTGVFAIFGLYLIYIINKSGFDLEQLVLISKSILSTIT
jgi:hypothetical protein